MESADALYKGAGVKGQKNSMDVEGKASPLVNVQVSLLQSNIAKGTTDPRVEFISQDHS